MKLSPRASRLIRAEAGVALLAALGPVLYLGYALARTPAGFPWDDAWIHATLARNLAETGALGMQAGRWGAGSSSLLWVFALALGFRIGLSPWLSAVLLGGISHIAASWAMVRLTRGVLGRVGSLLAGALYALFGPLVFLALSGMETAFFLALGLLSIWAWTQNRPFWAGALLGLLLLTRIEGLFLWGLLLVAQLLRPGRRTLISFLGLFLLPLAGLAAGSAVRLLSEGHLLPLTLSGRRWLWGLPPPGVLSPERMGLFLQNWRVYLLDWFLQAFRLENWPILHGAYLGVLLLWGLGGLAFLAWRTWQARREPRFWGACLMVLWGGGHLWAYLVFLPMPSFRHQAPFLPATLLLLAGGEGFLQSTLAWAFGRARSGWPRLVRGPAILALLFGAGLTLWQWQANYTLQVEHINRVHVRLAHWVSRNVPPQAVVAAFDIGALAYFGRHEVVDLGGLTDAAVLPYLYTHQSPSYLYERGATYLAMIGEPGDYWWRELGLTPPAWGETFALSLEARFEVPPYARPPFDRPADYYFYPASRQITLYAIRWIAPPKGP